MDAEPTAGMTLLRAGGRTWHWTLVCFVQNAKFAHSRPCDNRYGPGFVLKSAHERVTLPSLQINIEGNITRTSAGGVLRILKAQRPVCRNFQIPDGFTLRFPDVEQLFTRRVAATPLQDVDSDGLIPTVRPAYFTCEIGRGSIRGDDILWNRWLGGTASEKKRSGGDYGSCDCAHDFHGFAPTYFAALAYLGRHGRPGLRASLRVRAPAAGSYLFPTGRPPSPACSRAFPPSRLSSRSGC